MGNTSSNTNDITPKSMIVNTRHPTQRTAPDCKRCEVNRCASNLNQSSTASIHCRHPYCCHASLQPLLTHGVPIRAHGVGSHRRQPDENMTTQRDTPLTNKRKSEQKSPLTVLYAISGQVGGMALQRIADDVHWSRWGSLH